MTAPAIGGHRSVRIPSLMRLVRGPEAVIEALGDLAPSGKRLLFVHSGPRSTTGYGPALAARGLGVYDIAEVAIEGNAQPSLALVRAAIERTRPDFVVGVGGGRVVDVAKLAARQTGTEVATIPTQLASDAICSPIAIVRDAAGVEQSVGARMPTAIVIDLDVVDSAPRRTWLSGLGDLVSNLSAVRDWRMAHELQGESLDEAAALSVTDHDASLDDADYRQKLIRGLILSGIAMEMAGSSRPASGSEHLISHALDRILEHPRPHGLQVAAGTVAAGLLRMDDVDRLVAFYRTVGLPVTPGDLGIEIDAFIEAIRRGPSTRPGRASVLDRVTEADLDRLRVAYGDLEG
jgi:glycerol-1-phosphate dehydrogenase [NAD(P)+]